MKFKVIGSNRDTGARMVLEFEAESKAAAERKATQSGMNVNSVQDISGGDTVSVLALFAYTGFRVVPSANRIMLNAGHFRAGRAFVQSAIVVRDWKAGDPTWSNGKGKGLIGALDYLAGKGVNAFSFLTYNAAGDGDNVLIDGVTVKSLLEMKWTDGIDLDYLELTAPDLGPAPERGEARLLVAARVGTTRLIDNTALTLGDRAGSI